MSRGSLKNRLRRLEDAGPPERSPVGEPCPACRHTVRDAKAVEALLGQQTGYSAWPRCEQCGDFLPHIDACVAEARFLLDWLAVRNLGVREALTLGESGPQPLRFYDLEALVALDVWEETRRRLHLGAG
jgi:hypothetical protein